MPTNFMEWVGLLGLAVAGLFAIVNIFDTARRQRKDEENKADDRLIGLLKGQVDALEKKVEEQNKKVDEYSKKLEAVITENQTLREVLQGRDKQSVDYQNKGLEAMSHIAEILIITKQSQENIERLYKVIEKSLNK